MTPPTPIPTDPRSQEAQQEPPTDTEMLDWLEAQTNGMPWIARQSSTGRGYRVHNDPYLGEYETVREAIAAAMKGEPR